jgi:hypothetical protein
VAKKWDKKPICTVKVGVGSIDDKIRGCHKRWHGHAQARSLYPSMQKRQGFVLVSKKIVLKQKGEA